MEFFCVLKTMEINFFCVFPLLQIEFHLSWTIPSHQYPNLLYRILVQHPTLVVLSRQNFLPEVRPILRVWLSCEVNKNQKEKKRKKMVKSIEGSARKQKGNRFTYPLELRYFFKTFILSICYCLGYR